MLERTLLNIKPDAVERNLIGEIIRRVEANGYRIVALDKVQLERNEAEAFYSVHKDKPFFSSLIDYICSAPCVPLVVEGENVIPGLRELIGATNPAEAAEGTIRKEFAVDGRKNSVHASDSAKEAEREIGFFFSSHKLYLLSRNVNK